MKINNLFMFLSFIPYLLYRQTHNYLFIKIALTIIFIGAYFGIKEILNKIRNKETEEILKITEFNEKVIFLLGNKIPNIITFFSFIFSFIFISILFFRAYFPQLIIRFTNSTHLRQHHMSNGFIIIITISIVLIFVSSFFWTLSFIITKHAEKELKMRNYTIQSESDTRAPIA